MIALALTERLLKGVCAKFSITAPNHFVFKVYHIVLTESRFSFCGLDLRKEDSKAYDRQKDSIIQSSY